MAQFLHENHHFFRQQFNSRKQLGHAPKRYNNTSSFVIFFSVSSLGGKREKFAPEGIPLARFP